jgi:hypothetical protein
MSAKRFTIAFMAAFAVGSSICVPSALAGFGLNGFDVTFTNEDGSSASQAGSHPAAMTTSFKLNAAVSQQLGYEIPAGDIKDLTIDQIPGLVGDVNAVPRCATADFLSGPGGSSIESPKTNDCPDSTAVGTVALDISTNQERGLFYGAVYNLVPPPGVVARLGFIAVFSEPVIIELGVSSRPPYNVVAKLTNIPEPIRFYGSSLTLWGDPANPSHDALRGYCIGPAGESRGVCPSNEPDRPFLTLPTNCAGPLTTSFSADSWEEPGVWTAGSSETHDGSVPPNPLRMTGCGKLDFKPTVDAQPTSTSAASPSGLDFTLDVKDEGLTSSSGVAQSDIKKAVVTLPETMSVNPALAEGLAGCSESDLERETIGSAPGEGCPSESKIGTVEVQTPLIEQTLKGSLFLATPYENPFGSLIGLYVVIKDPETGILLKLPGKVEPNETTGQLVSVFDELPQLPFSDFRLHFREGQRSPLVTPPVCGTYATQADLTPWANPETALHETATFQVTSGIAGGPCPTGGAAPFKPGLIAGTQSNDAGNYSPVDIRITRNDGEQEITGFSSILPPGVTANLRGIPFCTGQEIAAAKAKSGAQEEIEPSCPAASQIGHTLVGVGVGSVLAYTSGKLYMAGPLEGAPFSVVSITSAKVGPFDLGTVVVHLPLNIDPVTAQVSIPAGAADQIPHIIKGIVVHVRDIRVYVDRPSFAINPTSCSPAVFAATVLGSGLSFTSPADDTPMTINDQFQTANCANLKFAPKFAVSASGKTSKAGGASLSVKLTFPIGSLGTQANIAKVKVDLPKQLPSRLTTLQKACTAAQFNTNPAGCPAASVVGHAKAITPILPVPLEGPAYFVSHGGEAFPSLIMVLQGYGITIDLVGSTFISKAGITSSTFKAVPDQPITSFELTLPQGKYSALAANGNLCTSKLAMPTAFVGQNGLEIHKTTPVSVTGCPKAKAPTRVQKLAKALKACGKDKQKATRAKCEKRAHKQYGPPKKQRKQK